MDADPCNMRSDWVYITASAFHGLPEEVHHKSTRGAHPELRVDPHNLRGLPHRLHAGAHAGETVEQEVDLRDVW